MYIHMPTGETGLGKSTLINTLFRAKISRTSATPGPHAIPHTTEVMSVSHGESLYVWGGGGGVWGGWGGGILHVHLYSTYLYNDLHSDRQGFQKYFVLYLCMFFVFMFIFVCVYVYLCL